MSADITKFYNIGVAWLGKKVQRHFWNLSSTHTSHRACYNFTYTSIIFLRYLVTMTITTQRMSFAVRHSEQSSPVTSLYINSRPISVRVWRYVVFSFCYKCYYFLINKPKIIFIIQTGFFDVSGSTVNISEMECNIIKTVCQHMQKHLGFSNVQFRKYPITCVQHFDNWILQWVSLAHDSGIKCCTQKTGHS